VRHAEPLVPEGCKVSGPNESGHRANGARQKPNQSQQADSANDDGDRKSLATMRARAALCGCTLHEMAIGEYMVARWNYSKAVPCLRAVGDLLRRIGGC
jgi:hypothetical protein